MVMAFQDSLEFVRLIPQLFSVIYGFASLFDFSLEVDKPIPFGFFEMSFGGE